MSFDLTSSWPFLHRLDFCSSRPVCFFFRILKLRFIGIGVLSKNWVKSASISGVIARSAGIRYDIRLPASTSYAYYRFLKFKTYLGSYGDLYDRILLMIAEIVESTLIITQVLFKTFVVSYQYDILGGNSSRGSRSLFYVEDLDQPRQYV